MWKFFELLVSLFLMAATASLGLCMCVWCMCCMCVVYVGRVDTCESRSLTLSSGAYKNLWFLLLTSDILTHPLSVSLMASQISKCRAKLPAEAALSVARSECVCVCVCTYVCGRGGKGRWNLDYIMSFILWSVTNPHTYQRAGPLAWRTRQIRRRPLLIPLSVGNPRLLLAPYDSQYNTYTTASSCDSHAQIV